MKKQNGFKRNMKAVIILICCISIVCVYFANSIFADQLSDPEIKTFKISPAKIVAGASVTLEWDILNAESIKFEGLEKPLSEPIQSSGIAVVYPTKSATYKLIVKGTNGVTVTKAIPITVEQSSDNPIIDYFTASATAIKSDESVVLSWKTTNTKSVGIEGPSKMPEDIRPLTGTLEVYPYESGDFVLTAESASGQRVSETITITVDGKGIPANINTFKASSTTIIANTDVTLSWDVSDAKSISIKGVQADLPATGSIVVAPSEATTYTLEAVSEDGRIVSKDVKITITKLAINSFTASKVLINRGDLVTLTWDTDYAESCSLATSNDQELVGRPVDGSINITPNVSTTYTLIAYDKFGNSISSSIRVHVRK